MLTILQISDLHFGPPFLERVGEALLKIAPTLLPDVIVISGDLTQRAKPQQFSQAREFMRALPSVPHLVVPGNHDVPLYRIAERLLDPHREYRRYISDELNQCYRCDRAVIVALDSTAPRQAISNGRIHAHQLKFCAESFRDTPADVARIVVAHHHFAPAPDYERDQTMPGSKRAINAFVDLRVDVVMGGHLHRAYIGNSLDVYPGAHRSRGIIIVQCGTTTSRRGRAREREKNSFNLLRVGKEMMRITHYMYFDDLDQFAPVSRHIFPRPGGQFVEDLIVASPDVI